MPIVVKISHEIAQGLFAAVGDFVVIGSGDKRLEGPAAVLVKEGPVGSYSLVLDESLYPSQLDGRTPTEYYHAPTVQPVDGTLTFSEFHITF